MGTPESWKQRKTKDSGLGNANRALKTRPRRSATASLAPLGRNGTVPYRSGGHSGTSGHHLPHNLLPIWSPSAPQAAVPRGVKDTAELWFHGTCQNTPRRAPDHSARHSRGLAAPHQSRADTPPDLRGPSRPVSASWSRCQWTAKTASRHLQYSSPRRQAPSADAPPFARCRAWCSCCRGRRDTPSHR